MCLVDFKDRLSNLRQYLNQCSESFEPDLVEQVKNCIDDIDSDKCEYTEEIYKKYAKIIETIFFEKYFEHKFKKSNRKVDLINFLTDIFDQLSSKAKDDDGSKNQVVSQEQRSKDFLPLNNSGLAQLSYQSGAESPDSLSQDSTSYSSGCSKATEATGQSPDISRPDDLPERQKTITEPSQLPSLNPSPKVDSANEKASKGPQSTSCPNGLMVPDKDSETPVSIHISDDVSSPSSSNQASNENNSPPSGDQPIQKFPDSPGQSDSENIGPTDQPALKLTLKLVEKDHGISTKVELDKLINNFGALSFPPFKQIDFSFALTKPFIFAKIESNKFFSEDLNLKVFWDNGKLKIESSAPNPYDGSLYIEVYVENCNNEESLSPKKYTKDMYIAPDPRSLWNDNEVEDYEGYEISNDDKKCKQILTIDKFVTAASCRGRSHAHVGKPRDDNFYFECDNASGWNFLAVADGAGSAKYSRKGSEIACQTAVKELKKLFENNKLAELIEQKYEMIIHWKKEFNELRGKKSSDQSISEKNINPLFDYQYRDELIIDKIFYNIVFSAYNNIFEEAKLKANTTDSPVSIKDYYTTLLFMGFKKFSFGYFFASFWIGDGAMVICKVNKTDKVLVLGSPDSGEFAGQTRFLTMIEEITPELVQKRTCCSFADDFESIILATDGITDPFFPSEASVSSEKKWVQFWDETLRKGDGENPGCPEIYNPTISCDEKAQALRKWLDFWSKGNHDDRTILIVN
ncbi:MAG: protein phosphatase 2C domain-containing protein [Deltaproteobacteria bacterium]|jgi:serine/threonine protein phosphatase PrpC|nr:protein phosphatase 2C domain-containing protein [Deltaproteobacteria bacterium]